MTRAGRRARIGTAGWSLPAASAELLEGDGTHLERYASRLSAVEINSSFYRPHRRTTYARWAASVPPDFRFSVKLPRTISHAAPGPERGPLIDRFADEAAGLGERLGALLVQFPPRHVYDAREAAELIGQLNNAFACPIVCEPRHAGWFDADVDAFFRDHRIARVAADPAIAPGAGAPGGWPGLRYYRLHGSPLLYRSNYKPPRLAELAHGIAANIADDVESWCIFDNTAAGAAIGNALSLTANLSACSR